jgi:hypothetical protein
MKAYLICVMSLELMAAGSTPKRKPAEIRKRHESKSTKLRAKYDSTLGQMETSFNDSVALLLEGYDKYVSATTCHHCLCLVSLLCLCVCSVLICALGCL